MPPVELLSRSCSDSTRNKDYFPQNISLFFMTVSEILEHPDDRESNLAEDLCFWGRVAHL